ncbi:sugar transferase [Psychromonas ossibalaenae]|uniref:sugar transferase n=1 Tax=Psychromonas ossibalaenae TaxID=444922 RepID=UPI00036D15A6|nr:sugar transferase [Psychromonas ossibalaenae]
MPIELKTVNNSLVITLVAYLTCATTLPKITKYLLVEKKYYVLPVMFSVYCLAITAIVLFRIDYSRPALAHGFFIVLVWLFISSLFSHAESKLKLNAINNFDIEKFNHHDSIDLQVLEAPYLFKNIRQGLVVNLHNNLTPEQEKFIADCSINNIPVFHSESIKEMLDGKVQTMHLSENSLGSLRPNPAYFVFKRFWESLLILISFPILLPFMLFICALIKLESTGSAIYTQSRIGQAGKPFKIYKFRSMAVNCPKADSKFATEENERVTKVGRIIRKTRIDEMPQFLNVLKGEMALIGPRPEQEAFVNAFEKEIPFYGYRHMVKPGITGWAQTVQGYTADTESTKEKLAHDLYYIKHLSFWLDVNIFFKTLKTICTGFGAK